MKVLIVDDEMLVRRSLRRVLESRGHQVLEAADGRQGLEVWRETRPELVILDVLMPGLTGPQVLAEMGQASKAKVVLISAYTGEYDLKKAKEMGADLFISKPFQNIFEVADRAESLLTSTSTFPPS
jgi:two-component system chemotaxis response regulator CheY